MRAKTGTRAVSLALGNMFKKNLNKETAIRTLMVASQYELVALKKEALNLIIKEVGRVDRLPGRPLLPPGRRSLTGWAGMTRVGFGRPALPRRHPS